MPNLEVLYKGGQGASKSIENRIIGMFETKEGQYATKSLKNRQICRLEGKPLRFKIDATSPNLESRKSKAFQNRSKIRPGTKVTKILQNCLT